LFAGIDLMMAAYRLTKGKHRKHETCFLKIHFVMLLL
jgi:hypothetical protein